MVWCSRRLHHTISHSKHLRSAAGAECLEEKRPEGLPVLLKRICAPGIFLHLLGGIASHTIKCRQLINTSGTDRP